MVPITQIQDQIRHLLSSPKDQYREDSRCRSDQSYDQDDHCGMFVIRHSVPYAKYQKCHHDGKGGVQRGLKN